MSDPCLHARPSTEGMKPEKIRVARAVDGPQPAPDKRNFRAWMNWLQPTMLIAIFNCAAFPIPKFLVESTNSRPNTI
jgi:hypothetical protein